ncbi:MAG: O-antigen ligase family protein [Candidatus Eisenbacteria bacterium]
MSGPGSAGLDASLLVGPPRKVGRIGWLAFLAFDLVLVALLPKATVLLAITVAVLSVAALVRKPILAASVAVYGVPLLWPLVFLGQEQLVNYVPSVLLVLPLAAIAWDAVWEFPRFGDRVRQLLRSVRSPAFGVALLFGLWLGCREIGSPSPTYGGLKTYLYFVSTLPLLLVGLAYFGGEASRRERAFSFFVRATLVLLFVFSIVGVWNSFAQYWESEGRIRVLGVNSIWVARFTGVGILLASSAWVGRRLRTAVAIPLLATFGVTFYLAGSRGPLLALLLAMVMWWTLGGRVKGRALVAAALGILATLFLLAVEFGWVLEGSPLSAHEGSNMVRALLLKVVYDQGLTPGLFGLGTGGFAAAAGVGDIRVYPHNILLEIWVELGVVGVLLLFAWLGVLCRTTVLRWREAAMFDGNAVPPRPGSLFPTERSRLRILATLTLYAFVNAQFSGDIGANQNLWFWAGLLTAPVLAGRSRPRGDLR